MSSPGRPEKVKRFKGKSGAECEDFIQTIREAAWKEGKLRDALWMADFASLHFSGKALIWHSDLSPDVRQDWFKQEKALLERWPPPTDDSDEEESEAAIVPTPAAVSLSGRSTREEKLSDIGVVQFVPISGDEESTYIADPDGGGECTLTTEVEGALRVRWDRSVNSGSRVLEWVGPGGKWLAIHWTRNDLNFDEGSRMWARLTTVDPTTLTPASLERSPSCRTFRTNVWKLSSGGRTTAVGNDGSRALELEAFTNRGYIFIAVHGDAYQKANPNEIRGRLVFKPME